MVEDSKQAKRLNCLSLNILKLSIIATGFTPHWEICHQWNMKVNIITGKR